jgi:hypothetical protein
MSEPSKEAPTDWCYERMPPVTGWFAVLRCYDSEEGIFPSTAYFTDGAVEWPETRSIAADGSSGHAGPFGSEQEAREWAYAHDPDWPDR